MYGNPNLVTTGYEYELVTSGKCDVGNVISTKEECEEAAASLGETDTTAVDGSNTYSTRAIIQQQFNKQLENGGEPTLYLWRLVDAGWIHRREGVKVELRVGEHDAVAPARERRAKYRCRRRRVRKHRA